MTNYLILLPPSEGKNFGGDFSNPYNKIKDTHTFKELTSQRDYVYKKVLEAISKEPEKKLEKIFDMTSNNLIKVFEIMSNLENLPTLKAIERYCGVMFKAIDYDNLSEKQKTNFNESVLFIDGLFGLLKPEDLMPDYKLK